MDLSKILSAAKIFFPSLANNIERAQQMAANFAPTQQGVYDLMSRLGKSRDDIQKALMMLNNPFVSGAIDKLAPNMSSTLKNAGSILMNTTDTPVSVSTTDVTADLKNKLKLL